MTIRYASIATCLSFLISISSIFAQGTLSPSAPPGEMMKTLEQVEPRIPIPGGDTSYSISQSGSYYLTSNRTASITIQADNVTLDLMGYSIAPTNDTSLRTSGNPQNMHIYNGILHAPAGNGIDFSSSTVAYGLLENLSVQGCQYYGMALGSGFHVRNCTFISNGIAGIEMAGSGKLVDCQIIDNPGKGIVVSGTGSYIANNYVKGNGDNYDLAPDNQLNLLLCEVPESLDWSCHALFTGSLTCNTGGVNGISVTTNNVTIDMNGYSLIGPGDTGGNGIYQDFNTTDLTVRNGTVTRWNGLLSAGIRVSGIGCYIENVCALTNQDGFYISDIGTIKSCKAIQNGSEGIIAHDQSLVLNCTAYSNAGYGIWISAGSTVLDSVSSYNGTGFSTSGSLIKNCTASYNSYAGIDAGSQSIVRECVVSRNTGHGISASFGCLIQDNLCHYNQLSGDKTGIRAFFNDNRIEGNTILENDIGVEAVSAGNFIAGNTASGNSTNWVIAAGNTCFILQAATNATAISGDSGGVSPGSTDPNANYTF